MQRSSSFVLLLLTSLFINNASKAQLPIVDITIVPLMDGRHEVRVRPDMAFDGLFSSLVFTLQWSSASSATFNFNETQDLSDIGMSVNPSGSSAVVGADKYQIFAAFGGAPFSASGLAWSAGQEFVLGQFTVTNGPVDVQIVSDSWTAANNGNYFVSLNGFNRTGIIYQSPASIDATGSLGSSLGITPNPADNASMLTVEFPMATVARVDVIDASGRICSTSTHAASTGMNSIPLSASQLADGPYQVVIRALGEQRAITWLVQHQ